MFQQSKFGSRSNAILPRLRYDVGTQIISDLRGIVKIHVCVISQLRQINQTTVILKSIVRVVSTREAEALGDRCWIRKGVGSLSSGSQPLEWTDYFVDQSTLGN